MDAHAERSSSASAAIRRRRVWAATGSLVLLVPAVTTLLSAGAGTASAGTLQVCPKGCQYSQIGPAVAAARSGDTIDVGPGTYRGGITITTSLRLAGAGAGSTIIRGGSHVLAIGAVGARSEPTVSISGVTITGGVARSSPVATALLGVPGLWAGGGGVEIPPRAFPKNAPPVPGATVTISDSVIAGNHADPRTEVPAGSAVPCPPRFPKGQCPFAAAVGGGIDSWGHLTLHNTMVSGNTTGPAAGLPALPSDSDGAGIYSQQGSLLLEHVRMSGNRAIAAIPDGRFAEGGAVFAGGPFGGSDRVTVLDSVVSGNRASLTSDLPGKAGGKLIDMNANSGGIHVGDHIPTTVERTAISGNSVSVRDLRGEPVDFDPGMLVGDSRLTMRDSVLSGNRLFAESATSAGPGPAGNVLELDGPGFISNTRITGNTTVAVSPHGLAGNAGAGLAVSNVNNDPRLVTVQGGVVSGNTAIARTSTGTATVQGVGVLSESLLTMTGVLVSRNTGRASGPAGFARGGGIWHGFLFSGKRIQLTLNNTVVTRNVLTGRAGIKVAGGGLFTRRPVTLNHVLIAANIPDQCAGCR